MGKGDKRTKKGKIFKGSFGNSRMKQENIKKVEVAAKPKKTTAKKTTTKKKAAAK
jgi:30S ribosomal protein S31